MKKVDFRTPEEFHRKLSLIFNATIAIPLLPFVLLFLEIKNREFTGLLEMGLLSTMIGYGIPVLSGLLVLKGFRVMEAEREKARGQDGLKQKLTDYYHGMRIMYSIVSVGSALMALGLWLTSLGVIVVAYVILLFVMSFYRPTPRKYLKDLNLVGEQKEVILNKKDFEF